MNRSISDYFSPNYQVAREKFIHACKENDLNVESYIHPLSESHTTEMATDVAIIGNPKASKVIVIMTGTHGLEALTGSGIQTGLIYKLAGGLPENVAVCFIHIINPWGAEFGRRQNEDNIDLNRNFNDFSKNLPSNHYYEKIHQSICSSNTFIAGEKNPNINESISDFINIYGETAYHTALFQGQHKFADGIGFGGIEASWSQRTLSEILAKFAPTAEMISAIDIHTGLGAYGDSMIIGNSAVSSESYDIANQWFGSELIQLNQSDKLPYKPHGDTLSAFEKAFPNAMVVSIALEYGTFAVDQLMALQIDDAWLFQFGDQSSELGQQIKQALWNFFYPNDNVWREAIFEKGESVVQNILQKIAN